MPLIPNALVDEVLKITDQTNPEFLGFPVFFVDDDPELGPDDERNNQATADNWANAVGSFLTTLTAPPGAGVAAQAAIPLAADAMKAALEGGSDGLTELVGAFGAAIELAGAAFATTQGEFSLSALPPTTDPVPPATSLEADVTTWVAAGTFTPPGGSPTPWS